MLKAFYGKNGSIFLSHWQMKTRFVPQNIIYHKIWYHSSLCRIYLCEFISLICHKVKVGPWVIIILESGTLPWHSKGVQESDTGRRGDSFWIL
jgi:hypothetical protein